MKKLFPAFLLVLFMVSACVPEDDIELLNERYIVNGQGTTFDRGSFEVHALGSFSNDGFAEVYFSGTNQVQRIRPGSSAYFPNLVPGTYHYRIDEFGYSSGVGVAITYSTAIGSNVGVSTGSYIGAPAHSHHSYGGVAEIRAGELLLIDIEL